MPHRLRLLPALLSCATLGLAAPYHPPASSRAVYNFNPDWKFSYSDPAGADQPGFADPTWASVSLPQGMAP